MVEVYMFLWTLGIVETIQQQDSKDPWGDRDNDGMTVYTSGSEFDVGAENPAEMA